MNPNVLRFLKYLDFKIKCAAYQQENPLRLNMPLVLKCIEELEVEQQEKVTQLKEVMPSVPKYSVRQRPKQTQKKDGTPTKKWTEWKLLCKDHGVPPVTTPELRIVSGHEEPNPNSSDQVKAWLESLGWEPCTLKYIRNKETNEERTIPQVRKEGELTPSVLVLKDQYPAVEILEGLTVIQHRLGVFKGYRDSAFQDPSNGNWYIRAEIGGLTNTLRFKHKKPIVNLPGTDKPFGKEIRECLMADDGETFIGTDMVSLESTTKRHFIYPLDPDYAEEMSQEGFDEHLDLALKNGAITREEYDFYVWYEGC